MSEFQENVEEKRKINTFYGKIALLFLLIFLSGCNNIENQTLETVIETIPIEEIIDFEMIPENKFIDEVFEIAYDWKKDAQLIRIESEIVTAYTERQIPRIWYRFESLSEANISLYISCSNDGCFPNIYDGPVTFLSMDYIPIDLKEIIIDGISAVKIAQANGGNKYLTVQGTYAKATLLRNKSQELTWLMYFSIPNYGAENIIINSETGDVEE